MKLSITCIVAVFGILPSVGQAQVTSWHQVSPLPPAAADQFWYGKTVGTTWFGGRGIADNYGGDLFYISGISGEGTLLFQLGFQSQHSLWIGLNDSAVEGTWAWDGGHPCSHSGSGVNTSLRDYVQVIYPGQGWHIALGNEGDHALIKIPPSPDCNANGIPDSAEIVDQPSLDANNNGQIDTCEDCNGNGVPDDDDIANGTSIDCDNDGAPDECQLAADPGLDWNGDTVLDTCMSANFCTAAPNSTGVSAVIGASGTPVILDNDFTLTASDLPVHEFGYFLMSESTGFVQGFGGSSGNLCLGAPIIRMIDPLDGGQVLNSGTTGTMSFTLDLTFLPQAVVLQPGDTWYFQLWFRDVFTSNTTDGIEVMFR